MNKIIIVLVLLISLTQAFDIWGTLNFGTKTEQAKKGKPSDFKGVMKYFEPKKAEFNLPRCLRNIADIIEEIEQLSFQNSFEMTLEKIVQKTSRYSEMLFSCGFAFQYQMFFKLFHVFNNQPGDQGTCGQQSGSCGQMDIDIGEIGNVEETFFEKIKPCASKVKEIYNYYSENINKPDANVYEEFKILIQSIRYTEECTFSVFTSFMDSSKPCVDGFYKLAESYHEIQKSSSIYIGLVYQGPALISAFNEMVSTCKDQIIEIVLPSKE